MKAFSVFTTARLVAGEIEFLQDHLQRLKEHATHFGIAYPGDDQIPLPSPIKDQGPNLVRISLSHKGFAVNTRPIVPPASYRIVITTVQVDPRFKHFKTTERAPYEKAAEIARGENALEALLLDEEGFVVDGSRSSPMLFRNNTLISLEGGLRGVTREAALKAAQERGISVVRAKLKPLELKDGLLLLASSGLGLVGGYLD